jgi:3-dehydroquinate synthetase
LRTHGLPHRVDGVAADEVLDYLARDKKRRGGSVPFVLVEAPGTVTHGHVVDDPSVRAAIEEVLG